MNKSRPHFRFWNVVCISQAQNTVFCVCFVVSKLCVVFFHVFSWRAVGDRGGSESLRWLQLGGLTAQKSCLGSALWGICRSWRGSSCGGAQRNPLKPKMTPEHAPDTSCCFSHVRHDSTVPPPAACQRLADCSGQILVKGSQF